MCPSTELKASPAGAATHGRLLAWLDDGGDSNGERYAEIRRRLIGYFDRWNRPAPEALADETFRRISSTLAHGMAIAEQPPARHCYVVARRVLLEDQGGDARSRTAVPQRARRLDALDHHLAALPPVDRALVFEYYRDPRQAGADHRRQLAERMDVTPLSLGQRAARIRDSLMCRTMIKR